MSQPFVCDLCGEILEGDPWSKLKPHWNAFDDEWIAYYRDPHTGEMDEDALKENPKWQRGTLDICEVCDGKLRQMSRQVLENRKVKKLTAGVAETD